MTNNQPCHATREGDELVCRACRLRWDVNDPERPECRKAPPKFHVGGVALPSAPHLVGPGLAKRFAGPVHVMQPHGWVERFVSGLPDREPRN